MQKAKIRINGGDFREFKMLHVQRLRNFLETECALEFNERLESFDLRVEDDLPETPGKVMYRALVSKGQDIAKDIDFDRWKDLSDVQRAGWEHAAEAARAFDPTKVPQ